MIIPTWIGSSVIIVVGITVIVIAIIMITAGQGSAVVCRIWVLASLNRISARQRTAIVCSAMVLAGLNRISARQRSAVICSAMVLAGRVWIVHIDVRCGIIIGKIRNRNRRKVILRMSLDQIIDMFYRI